MELYSTSFTDGERIPGEFAFAVPDAAQHIKLSSNRNPHLAWRDVPSGTLSLVIVCHDPDAPSRGDDVNKEGRTVAADLPRVDFYHWLLVDLPPNTPEIEAGEFSEGVTPRGKSGPQAPFGARQGLNDYTGWFATDAEMEGQYFGYDGPCPPWNDERVHRYIFTLYALDIARCPLQGQFKGADVLRAIEGHVLAEARVSGTYTLNPAL